MLLAWMSSSARFFFQAEDGIRDTSVTGVQTCALPIYLRKQMHEIVRLRQEMNAKSPGQRRTTTRAVRSEERRVGKECRARPWGSQCKNQQAAHEGHDAMPLKLAQEPSASKTCAARERW